ncbi:PEROXIDASE 25-RELATED [Salix viminalis]|uniref:peroxidase n=1 Tax=Salix viminalis TaxID=40686 RepID=A0A9Q0V5Y4_SALVM|nr:PEROXIDASE 25-RELATED [Salix viminalis]
MARTISSALIFLLLPLLLQFYSGKSELQFNYYAQSCPRAEEIIKEQVVRLYSKHGNTAVSWVRNLFHDCMVQSCDASLLLETLGGPRFEMKTGRRDSTESYGAAVEDSIPNHNDSISLVLSRFQSIGVDVEGTVALLGSHSVGRVHCVNLVHRIYPTVDPTMDPDYAEYLKRRCPTPDPDPQAVLYSRNDRETPMILDNNYYKNLLGHKGLLMVDQQLTSDPLTSPYVEKMAADNGYFHDQFSRAVVLLSENNPLTGDQGEIRKDCRFVNSN